MPPTASVSRRAAERVHRGHPWIYQSDLVSVDADPGDLVRVLTERDRPIGWAFWNSQSQIALRMVSTATAAQPLDERELFTSRIDAAVRYRDSLAIDSTACRLISAEADRLPGVIVDCYADDSGVYLVVQTLSLGADRRLADIVDLLVARLQPRGVLVRNDPRVRHLEGLDDRVEVVYGEVPELIDVREGDVTFSVDVRHGQKTGLFLDQRENHIAAAEYTRGRALDAFTYNGGFALALARRADHVLALDSSAPAVAATLENAKANGVTNVEVRETNVFDELRELEIAREQFQMIVLDPPAFAKNRASVVRAVAGYKEINLRALKLLAPGGYLMTCSCSYNIDEALFMHTIQEAAIDAHATVVLVEKRTQARDHPILLNVPETYYLKCLVLRRLE
jgi:23S rRNA (cytosine1962-C5)-methyltransferase